MSLNTLLFLTFTFFCTHREILSKILPFSVLLSQYSCLILIHNSDSLNNFTDIGIGHCVESYIDNVKEEFDRVSLTVREEEDWVVSAGNREEGAKIWTEH